MAFCRIREIINLFTLVVMELLMMRDHFSQAIAKLDTKEQVQWTQNIC